RHLFHGVVAADRLHDLLFFPLRELALAVAILFVARLLGRFKVGAGLFVPGVHGRLACVARRFVMLQRGRMVAQSARCDLGEVVLVRRGGIQMCPGMIVAGCRMNAPAAGPFAGFGFAHSVGVGLDIGWGVGGFVLCCLRIVLDELVVDRIACDRFRTM